MLAGTAQFGLHRTARPLPTRHLSSTSSSSSSRLPCSCRLSSLLKKKKKKKRCRCQSCQPCLQENPRLPTRQRRRRQMRFLSLASLSKGNIMCNTSICESALFLLVFTSSDQHLIHPCFTESKTRRHLLCGARNSAFPSLAQSQH